MSQDQASATGRNFYGRIKGKTLRPTQKANLQQDLDALRLHGVSEAENPDRHRVDPADFFDDNRPLWLEIGFGGGEHLVYQCTRNPDIGFIGCEPFINGVAMLLGKLRQTPLSNLRIHPWDVRELFDVLPDACIDRAFLLYPDPWPKTRHHRRRFVTPDHLNLLARVLKPRAIFRVATDIPDYVRQTLEEVPPAGFDCLSPDPEDLSTPWEDWFSTRYEQKALREGRRPHYLTFQRNTQLARA
ncbi:MAG: tRNA (guanosine(46)-N7)-methyltransferase TrmB [Natronohydrobacter sp.]|nr:tRNA (guanosine(46)-N7)-methyltransferase TrmB [Natronohydrobacter sp.]